MSTIFDSIWFRSIGSILMVSVFVGYVTYMAIYRILRNCKKKIGIDGLDILLICAIPTGIAFTWRWIGQILDLTGIHIAYDSSLVFPVIHETWIRIVFLTVLILSVIGATIMFCKPFLTSKPHEKTNAKYVLSWMLITLGAWMFAGFPSLQYVIGWICH